MIRLVFRLFIVLPLSVSAQHNPDFWTDTPTYSTFSIIAYEEETQQWGIAVATHNLYVGNSTIYIEPGVGAFSVIAETHPDYAHNGFEQLAKGKSIQEAIEFTRAKDKQAHYRQVSGVDHRGNTYAFTGEALAYWGGKSTHKMGNQFVVMGNQLADEVLDQMAATYEQTKGTLAERLLASLVAGQVAGGQISGKQSAALVVKGTNNAWYNQIDLRVDHSPTPFQDLQRLLNYHYGRIQINQSISAAESGDEGRAKEKLEEAEQLLEGWNGMYGKLALAHSILGNKKKAVQWVQQALLENPDWKVNLPGFYYLHDQPEMRSLIDPNSFSVKDWEQALRMMIWAEGAGTAVHLGEKLIEQDIQSSYVHFLVGRCYAILKQPERAKEQLVLALTMDENNIEAQRLLKSLPQGN